MKDQSEVNTKFFKTPLDFCKWLAANHEKSQELWVGFYKKDSGKPSITWPESVDEALCVGWIDGIRKRIGEDAYQIRFTPRRAGSIWSAINIAKAKALIASGRMKAAGLKAFERRTEQKSRVYSYEQQGSAALAPADIRAFKKDKAAWAHYEKLPPGYRRMITLWVTGAKREETRAR